MSFFVKLDGSKRTEMDDLKKEKSFIIELGDINNKISWRIMKSNIEYRSDSQFVS